jgi:pyruvate,water dikinase
MFREEANMGQKRCAKKPLLVGMGVSSGCAVGRVQFFGEELEARDNDGVILVAEHLTPSMVVVLSDSVAGIVTEVGGMLCHAATIARERGIPCVVRAMNACTILKKGEKILIDGGKGEVYGAED